MIKRYVKVLIACCLSVVLFTACAQPADIEVKSDEQVQQVTKFHGVTDGALAEQEQQMTEFSGVTDETLVETFIRSEALNAWGMLSSVVPESAEGIAYLIDNSEEFAELLLGRDTGLESIKEYGPVLIERYREHENGFYRLNASFMENLMNYMFPGEKIVEPIG